VALGDRRAGPRLSRRDAVNDVWLDLVTRFSRSCLTALGTLIGIAVLVSTLGLAKSASARITTRFDALAATEVVVKALEQRTGTTEPSSPASEPGPIPFDAERRLSVIDGVTSSSTYSHVKSVKDVSGTPVNDPTATTSSVGIVAASPQLLSTVHGAVSGRFFDRFHDDRAEAVAVLGADAAKELNVSGVDRQPAIFLDGRSVVVIGIITSVGRKAELMHAVVLPDGLARAHYGLRSPEQVLVESRIGAADVVGAQAPYALRPDTPEALEVIVPPTPTLTRDQVSADTNALFLVLGGISLLIGGLGIANVTLVSVMERVPEIGLRRALGARRAHVIGHFLMESTALGLLGAVAGTAVGVLTTVAVARLRGWPPVMHPWLPLLTPLLGGMIGLLSGVYPALRAGRIEPIDALRAA
jgi:ABC-type antimicrobial peptide transport system permease subunit